jgi:hypothetical protein
VSRTEMQSAQVTHRRLPLDGVKVGGSPTGATGGFYHDDLTRISARRRRYGCTLTDGWLVSSGPGAHRRGLRLQGDLQSKWRRNGDQCPDPRRLSCFGGFITDANFISFDYSSSSRSFNITGADDPGFIGALGSKLNRALAPVAAQRRCDDGRNAQIAAIAGGYPERIKSTLCCPTGSVHERAGRARKRSLAESDGCATTRCPRTILSADQSNP